MQHEIVEAARPMAIVASGAAGTWYSHENLSSWVSLAVGILTIIYIIVQMVHLLRVWYMKERMYEKRKHPSDFMHLDEK